MRRKVALTTGEVYHVFNKSIAGYEIFNYEEDFLRMKQMFLYYCLERTPMQFSNFLNLDRVKIYGFNKNIQELNESNHNLVQIIAYCIMPTHFHLAVKQLIDKGITKFMGNTLNSYSRYFNLKQKRKGPLWVGPFKNVRVQSDEQLLHLTRYIHLNPVTASIVNDPGEWSASSYGEYISSLGNDRKICDYRDILDIEPKKYKLFVQDGVNYYMNYDTTVGSVRLRLSQTQNVPGSGYVLIDSAGPVQERQFLLCGHPT